MIVIQRKMICKDYLPSFRLGLRFLVHQREDSASCNSDSRTFHSNKKLYQRLRVKSLKMQHR